MSDVFISYGRTTARRAKAVADALRAAGHSVWLDEDLPAHRAYADVIEERLRSAKAVVVVWSQEAAKSLWVRAEANVALELGTLVQLSIDGTLPPMPFNQVQCAELNGWSGDVDAPGWRKVSASVADLLGAPLPVARASPARTLAFPDKPSIAVLPFANLGGDAEQAYFADGMVEEITNALTRYAALFVIANSSTLGYRSGARDLRAIGRELGVRYLLEGSVRKAAGHVRVAVKLVSSVDTAQIWTQQFDGTLEDVFALQDNVAHSVAGALNSTLETAEIERVAARPSTAPGAYELYLQALPFSRAWDRASVERALELAEAAIEQDAKFAPALMLAGFARSQLLYSGWADDPQTCRRLGLAHCRRALKLAPDDPMVLSLASSALPSLGVNFTEGRRLADRALEINPGSAGNMLGSGWTNAIDGDAELALRRFDEALRLDPRSPLRFFNLTGQGIALFALQRFDAAAAILSGVAQAMPDYPPAQVFLAGSLAHLGRLDEARAAFERAGAGLEASLTILREPARRALLLAAITLADKQAD